VKVDQAAGLKLRGLHIGDPHELAELTLTQTNTRRENTDQFDDESVPPGGRVPVPQHRADVVVGRGVDRATKLRIVLGMPATAATRDRLGPPGLSRIAAVPFTLRNLKEDLEDLGSNFDGAPDLEFRLASKALELEQSGLSYQRIPPDYRFPYGHTHKEQEELYVVVRGSGRMKLDDEIVEVREWDVVRVPPGTWRGYEGGPEGLEILVFGAPNLGENPRDDVDGQRDWWAG
jgi:mannose-6-phosphate isomerase-like protein (cupin superfamily)